MPPPEPELREISWNDKSGYLTRKMLPKHGLSGALKDLPDPVGYLPHNEAPNGKVLLYDPAKCKKKKERTEAQKNADYLRERVNPDCCYCGHSVDTIETRYYRDGNKDYLDLLMIPRKELLANPQGYACLRCSNRIECKEWAQKALALGKDGLILDTETIDLHDEVIEMAIVDMLGKVIFNGRFQPYGAIKPEAQAIHGISADMLVGKPRFGDFYPEFLRLVQGKQVFIYNADFDLYCIGESMRCHIHFGLPDATRENYLSYKLWKDLPEQQKVFFAKMKHAGFKAECVMLQYAQYCSEWSDYHGGWEWQSLNGGHSALSDCQATLELIQMMAKWEAEKVIQVESEEQTNHDNLSSL